LKLVIKRYEFGDITCCYIRDTDTGKTAFMLLPTGKKDAYAERREFLDTPEVRSLGIDCPAWEVGAVCHLSIAEMGQSGGAGQTMKYSEATGALHFVEQSVRTDQGVTTITTVMSAPQGYSIRHTVVHYTGRPGVEISTEFTNTSSNTWTLEMITSFSMDGLSPFDTADSAERLILHRFRGGWSLEGKEEKESIEDLNLERPWINMLESERYGCTGSYPVGRWFPFGAVEDTKENVVWAAQLACSGPWQMELTRTDDTYSLSGGLADREMSGWCRRIMPGESFCTPKAYVTVGIGNAEDIFQRIPEMLRMSLKSLPDSESELPVLFNDWCAFWGNPSEEKTLSLAHCLADRNVKYLVIDAGWSKTTHSEFGQGGNGDWEVDNVKFPHGLRWLSQRISEYGMKLGLWFEFEVTTKGAAVFEKEYDELHLKRSGSVIKTGGVRSFWDFRRADVREYLRQKVIFTLKQNEIGYLKVDYNGSIGAGCDGSDSPAEGLRQQMEAVKNFFMEIHREIPELVIENCAAGGHRLEPSMMQITSMSSASDAHECPEIPYLAAGLQLLIPPSQSQIWVVLHPEQSKQEMQYRLTAGVLGRMCLSGRIDLLDKDKQEIVSEALEFYNRAAPVVRSGLTKILRDCNNNRRCLRGVQLLTRTASDGSVLAVAHTFAEAKGKKMQMQLKCSGYSVAAGFGEPGLLKLSGNELIMEAHSDYEGEAVLLIPSGK
jgi:alpha-galactosidase